MVRFAGLFIIWSLNACLSSAQAQAPLQSEAQLYPHNRIQALPNFLFSSGEYIFLNRIADFAAAGVPTKLGRQARAAGLKPPNHKRVYRVMKVHGPLLDRHVGGAERRDVAGSCG
jgi:hypothetical protein